MIRAAIDHLVVTATSLVAGVDYVHDVLGKTARPGGRHARMGTHNALLKLDDSTYLEILAIDPAARPPGYPRWFGLDELIASSEPALAAWVARVDDIHVALAAAGVPGDVRTMNRGELEWLIAMPDAGALLSAGVMPALIQWLNEPHPAQQLEDSGCTLESLCGFCTDGGLVTRTLSKLSLDPRWTVASATAQEKPGLVASIRTPRGIRTLVTRNRA